DDVKMHLEFTAARDLDTERHTVNRIASAVHSVGCDTSELKEMMNVLELERERGSDSVLANIILSLDVVMNELNLERFHTHTKNFLCVVTRKDYGIEPEKIRNSLLFGGYAAVAKTTTGHIPDREDLNKDYDFHFSREGLDEM
ncbi:MAG: ADP-dependent glucokinase/phosphofructokinase, partial [Candidatus Aenigmatarchaeota archaeon]